MEDYKVYRHISPSNKAYVGITKQNIERRWRKGDGYKPVKGKQSYFYNAILKYGWDNFEHIIMYEGLNKDEAELIECELIDKYDLTNPRLGYNLRLGGGSSGKFTDEMKKKLSDSKIGKNTGYRAPEIGVAISKAKMGHAVSEEARDKISKTLTGRYLKGDSPSAKKIICIETGEIFECCKDACEKYDIQTSNMSKHLKGERNHVRKLHFKFT